MRELFNYRTGNNILPFRIRRIHIREITPANEYNPFSRNQTSPAAQKLYPITANEGHATFAIEIGWRAYQSYWAELMTGPETILNQSYPN